MNIDKNVKNKGTSSWFHPHIIIDACCYVIGDTNLQVYIHPIVLYEYCLICIFMNISKA